MFLQSKVECARFEEIEVKFSQSRKVTPTRNQHIDAMKSGPRPVTKIGTILFVLTGVPALSYDVTEVHWVPKAPNRPMKRKEFPG